MRKHSCNLVCLLMLLSSSWSVSAQGGKEILPQRPAPEPLAATVQVAQDKAKSEVGQPTVNDEDGLIIPEGTEMQLALREPVSSKLSEPGDDVLAVVRKDVVVDGRTVLQAGTEVVGRVTLAQPAGKMMKGGRLHLTFDRVRLPSGERRLSAVIKSASDFSRDEKVKSDGEGTLQGGKDGGNVMRNVSTVAGLGSMGASVILLAGAGRNGFGGLNGIGGGTLATYGAVLGGSAVAAIFLSKGKEVRLDQDTVVRLKLERPLRVER